MRSAESQGLTGGDQEQRDKYSQPGDPLPCLQCANPQCSCDSHRHDLYKVTKKLLDTMADCALENLEATKGTTGEQQATHYSW